jgi:hypothetical protein
MGREGPLSALTPYAVPDDRDREEGKQRGVVLDDEAQLDVPTGHVPPAEFEADDHRRENPSRTAGLKDPSLR